MPIKIMTNHFDIENSCADMNGILLMEYMPTVAVLVLLTFRWYLFVKLLTKACHRVACAHELT